MKTKKLALGLFTAAATFALAACGSRADNNTSSTASSGAASSAGAEKSELVVYVDESYVPVLEKVKGDFESANNATVTINTGDMLKGLDNLSLDNQSNAAPDVMLAPYDRTGGLGKEGQLREVKLANDSEFDNATKQLVTSEGNIYGVPFVIESIVLYYNKDLITEAPKTFEDLEKLAADSKYAFAGEEGKTSAFLANWTDFYYTNGLLSGYGSYVFGKNGTDPQDIGLANEGAVAGAEYAKTWYDKWPQGMLDTTGADNFIFTNFTEGKTAAIIEGPWKAADIKAANVNFGVAKIPTLPNGKEYQTFGGGKAWVIPTGSKAPELAQKFVDYLGTADVQKVFYDEKAEIPANTTACEYAVSKNDELTNAVIAQFEFSTPLPNLSEMSEVWAPAGNMLFDVASGSKDAKTATADAVQLIKDAIQQKFGN